ncbi:MAG TPA: DUF1285 domain-containing protein [Alphaproteobacteria bacterium]|nr:DUF1285 domain-containing protein [Alphaproteobacteria bacterium]
MIRHLPPEAQSAADPASGAESATGMRLSSERHVATPCGEFDIRIGPDGTWFYHGSPITRKPLVKLFASVLRREESGEYWLITPAEKGRIAVDDAPFVAVELAVVGEGRTQQLIFRTNIDEIVTAGPDHHIRVTTDTDSAAPRPYLGVGRGLEALIARPVFYQLVELGVEESRADGPAGYGVWSCGRFFPLGSGEWDQSGS